MTHLIKNSCFILFWKFILIFVFQNAFLKVFLNCEVFHVIKTHNFQMYHMELAFSHVIWVRID